MNEILAGFMNALQPLNLAAMAVSVAIGIMIGALPGLSAAMGVALLIPITFGMPASTGLIVLAGVYCGAIFGGSISAILIHTPGTPASAATAIDGYQLTLKGKAGKALGTAIISSFFGGLLSCISLYFFAPALAKLAMAFGSPEYFWLSIFGLTIIAGVSTDSLLKGLISGALGLLLSTVGMDPMNGVFRFTFGQAALYEGLPFTATLIGLFSMSQVLVLAEKKIRKAGELVKFDDRVLLNGKEMKQIAPTIVRSWIIGNLIGILPGAGASIASFMGYNEARRASKHKEEFGHGSVEGIAAAESANNAVTGATLIPLLTLGIPGDGCVAIMLSALMINGLNPGLSLFTTQGDIMYAIMIGLLFVNLFMLIQGKYLTKLFAKVVSIPQEILTPIIVIFCFAGAYSVNKSYFDVAVILVFAVIAWTLYKLDFPTVPILLGLVLGNMTETNFRRALLLSEGRLSIFVSSGYCIAFLVLITAAVAMIIKSKIRERSAGKGE